MKEVMAVIRPEKWQATCEAANALGVEEVMRHRVLGRGHQQGLRYLRPIAGDQPGVMEFLAKRMVTWLVPDQLVEPLVAAIIRVNRTGSFGDGKVFVCPMDAFSPVAEGEALAGSSKERR